MSQDVSAYISCEDVAKSLIGHFEQEDGANRFLGHVIGFPKRKIALSRHQESFEALLSRPALKSYIEDGASKRSIFSFGVLRGFQIGRLYINNTISSVFLRPYKFVTLTIVCAEDQQIYSADQPDTLHVALSLSVQAFERLAELIRLRQMCSAQIPALIWKGPSLNYFAMEASEKNYLGGMEISAYDDDALDFGLDDLKLAAFGA